MVIPFGYLFFAVVLFVAVIVALCVLGIVRRAFRLFLAAGILYLLLVAFVVARCFGWLS